MHIYNGIKKDTSCPEQILEVTPHKTVAVQPPAFHLMNHSSKRSKIVVQGEVRTRSLATFSDELLHMDTPVLIDQQKLSYIISVWDT